MDPPEPVRRGADDASSSDAQGRAAHDIGRASRRPRWSELIWLGILAAIGVVQVVRMQWFDAAVYAAVVALLIADLMGVLPAIPARRRASARLLLGAAAVLGIALCLMPRHSPGMSVVVLIVGVVALLLCWPQSTGTSAPWSRGLQRLAIAWSVILVAGCLWELLQFILGRIAPAQHWFALSDLIDPLVATAPGRILFILAWLGAGIFLIRRGRQT